MTNSTPNPIVDEKIYVVPVTALTPFPGNPRRGNVDVLAESLRTNGQYRPVVVRRETREILAGNHTVQAAQKLGWENVKVQFVDGLTDAQAKKIVLADNRTTDLASYSMPDLTALLEDLSSNDSLTGTGFTEFDFTALQHLTKAPDLDALADDIGDVTDDDKMVRVTLVLQPDVAKVLNNIIATRDHTETVKEWLLGVGDE